MVIRSKPIKLPIFHHFDLKKWPFPTVQTYISFLKESLYFGDPYESIYERSDMTSGICFTLIQLVKGHGSTEETNLPCTKNCWSWVMGTWELVIPFSQVYICLKYVCAMLRSQTFVYVWILFKKCLRLQRRDSRIVLSNCKPLVSLGTPMTGENNAQLKI